MITAINNSFKVDICKWVLYLARLERIWTYPLRVRFSCLTSPIKTNIWNSFRWKFGLNIWTLGLVVKHTGLQNPIISQNPPATPYPIILHTQALFLAHDHVCWATFNMPVHFPSVERQTGRLSDCQSAVITFTAPHWSAAPQTPGKLPQPLTFPLEKNPSM